MNAAFTPNSTDPTSGGALMVSDGTQSDTIKLVGDYTQSSWTLSQDSNGGTLVVDPPLPATTMGNTPAGASRSGANVDAIAALLNQFGAAGFNGVNTGNASLVGSSPSQPNLTEDTQFLTRPHA